MNKLLLILFLIPSFCSGATIAERLMATDSETRASAQQEASALSPHDLKAVLADLTRSLQKEDIDEREHAAQALGLLGPAAEGAIPALRQALNDDLPFVRFHSAETLVKIGPPAIPALTEALKNKNGEIRTMAAKALGNFGEPAKAAIPNLVTAMQDPELSVRGSAIVALGKMGPSAESALPALKEAAQSSDTETAAKATEVIKKIQSVAIGEKQQPVKPVENTIPEATQIPSQPPATTVVVKKPISHPKPPTKKPTPLHKKAVKKVVAPPPPPPTPEELMTLMQSTDTTVQMNAEAAIVQRSSETLPVLIPALQGASTTLADISANLLEKIGSDDAKKAVDAYHQQQTKKHTASLLKGLRAEGKTSEEAAGELVKIGAPIVTPVGQMLTDPRPSVRRAAATVLNQLGNASQPATSLLIDATDDKDADVRQQAAEALRKIGTPDAQKALRFFPIKDKLRRLVSRLTH